MAIADIEKMVESKLADFRTARKSYKSEREELAASRKRLGHLREAQRFVQEVAETVQQHVHGQVAGVVSRCLTGVFDDPYEFRVLFERKRGRTEASLVFERGGEVIDPLSASGGGVVDVAAFALRLSCLVLHRPPLRRVLILDEPFRFVSAQYREAVVELLRQLARDMGVQIVMVTHIRGLEVCKIVRV